MPGDSEHPVTVGDLRISLFPGMSLPDTRPATVADLVLALRAEGVLVVADKGDAVERIGLVTTDSRWSHIETPLLLVFALAVLDALAEAQDGGEVPKDPWDYDP